MLKVLIADDEKNICLMIQKLVQWEDYGMQVIGLANNGVEAAEIMKKEKPDLIISDIRMPGYDGLELVSLAHELGIEVKFIIISGYKYFEYAHRALKMGVEYYLLKPIDKRELKETLEKICIRKSRDTRAAEETADLRRQIHHIRREAKKHFLSSIIEEDRDMDDLDLSHINTEYQCEFEQGCFLAVFAKIDSSVWERDMTRLLHIVEEIIDEDVRKVGKEYISSIVNSGVISIINYRDGEKSEVKNGVEKTFQKIRIELDKFSGYHITYGIGSAKSSIKDIAESVREAIYAIKCRGKAGVDRIIWYEQLHYQKIPLEHYVTGKNIIRWKNMVESLDYGSLRDEIGYVEKDVCKVAFYSPVIIYEVLEYMEKLIIDTLKQNHIEERCIEKLGEELQAVLDFYTDISDLMSRFAMTIQVHFEKFIEEGKNKNQMPIRMAKKYIQEHYMEMLTLEEVAGAIHLSGPYFSTMFKKELGINFSDYLISCRLEAAKKLLKSTDLSIMEIAQRVGYTESRYFSRTFQKVVGVKPSVYRKMYR